MSQPKFNRKTGKPLVSPFSSNYMIVNHKRQHRFIHVPKTGVSTIKAQTIIDDGLIKLKPGQKIDKPNALFGFKPNGKSIIEADSDKYSDYKTVVIWRDPKDRFYSWYKNKVRYNPELSYTQQLALGIDDSLERALEFLQFELGKSHPAWIEPHVRPQSLSYDPKKIDLIVKLEDLSDYLKTIGVDEYEIYNKSVVDAPKMTKTHEETIKELYAADYDLINKYKAKVWQKGKLSNLKQKLNRKRS